MMIQSLLRSVLRSLRALHLHDAHATVFGFTSFIASCTVMFALVPAAHAGLRDYTVRWLPSPSANVEGYELSVAEVGGAAANFDLGSPAEQGGEIRFAMEVEDTVDLELKLRAYDGDAFSDYSNTVVVAAASAPAEPTFGVTQIEGATGVVSGSIVVVAETFGAPGSVAFDLDGVSYRIENVVPYSLEGDGGQPGTENPFDTTPLADGEHTIVATAWSESSGAGSPSAPVSVTFFVDNQIELPPAPDPDPIPDPSPSPDPEPTPDPGPLPDPEPTPDPDPDPTPDPGPPAGPSGAVAGLYSNPDGDLSALHADGTTTLLGRFALTAGGDMRPAWCDLDHDGDRDLVIGFGADSSARLLLLIMEDGAVLEDETMYGAQKRYRRVNGETWPSCGDIDGDGLNELVVGLGAGSYASVSILDDREAGHVFMRTSPKRAKRKTVVRTLPQADLVDSGYVETGPSKPVVADIDGDGLDEIIVGRGVGGRGTISIIDDALHGFQMFEHDSIVRGVLEVVKDADYIEADGSTEVSASDVDGDGLAEIVVGTGPKAGSRLYVLDDAVRGFALLAETASSTDFSHPGYDVSPGALVPSLADVDDDGLPEIAIGFGEGAEGAVQLLDDLLTGFAPLIWTGDAEGIVTAPGGTGLVSSAIEAAP